MSKNFNACFLKSNMTYPLTPSITKIIKIYCVYFFSGKYLKKMMYLHFVEMEYSLEWLPLFLLIIPLTK